MALDPTTDIAVVGMACRFPGAPDLDAYWQLLRSGLEGIRHFTPEELIADGVSAETLADPQYVRAYGWLEGIDQFDAGFFGYTPLEARLMDPQHRLFLETCWHAFEHAGIRPDRLAGAAAVFAGAGQNAYRLYNLSRRPDVIEAAGPLQFTLANDPDFISSRVSYKLGLTGPSMDVQTACSTSLVAAHLAVQSLLIGEADVALAGGASIVTTRKEGYRYIPGGTSSPDGHTRTFDARAKGMVGGDGVGVVVLKRLEDALADGNTIYAVIRGTAVNNDGADRIGFTAPGIEGQARVIAEAQAVAGVTPEEISYVELHGTATPLGDPIEFAALVKAFAGSHLLPGSVGLGSVKSNIGHTNAAAGAAGIIKVALSLHHGELPPSLHFERPNPEIPLDGSPFYVNTALKSWKDPGRTAGVSSFGMGGTNAHAILAAAPSAVSGPPARPFELLTISAKSTAALEQSSDALAAALSSQEDILSDAAFTLHTGRQALPIRRAVVAAGGEQAAEALRERSPRRVFTAAGREHRSLALLLPGQGAQYPGMAHGIYETEPVFRHWLDRCAALFEPHIDRPLLEILSIDPSDPDLIHQTRYTQPAVFAVSYAAARLFMAWGVRPAAMLGHSIGELTAACLAGVFSLEDACRVVAARGTLMNACNPGAMLSIQMPEEELRPRLPEGVEIAVINEPGSTVISGSLTQIEAFEAALASDGISSARVRTSHAFHSAMMDPALAPFRAILEKITLSPPAVPFISNVTGGWITSEQAVDPGYWAQQLRSPVRFSIGIARLLELPEPFLLETGPGTILSSLARRNGAQTSVSAGRHPQDSNQDAAILTSALGQLWLSGFEIDWEAYHIDENRRSVPLPLYPFERMRHWVSPEEAAGRQVTKLTRQPDISNWFYLPSWERADYPSRHTSPTDKNWLVFFGMDDPAGKATAARLSEAGARLVIAPVGAAYSGSRPETGAVFSGGLQTHEDAGELAAFLRRQDFHPDHILHFCPSAENPGETLDQLLLLVRLIDLAGWAGRMDVTVVTRGGQEVLGGEILSASHAAAAGLGRVVPQEYPGVRWKTIDLETQSDPGEVDHLHAEFMREERPRLMAFRGQYRWEQGFEPVRLAEKGRVRRGGVYLITGGLGGIGRALAASLIRDFDASVALISRSAVQDDPRLASLPGETEKLFVLSADAGDPAQMASALAEVETRFGPLNGVFHAAGRTGAADFRYLPETTSEDFSAHLGPKLYGAQSLAGALGNRPLDFCLLFSSISGVLGGLGFAAYAAANAALDAFAVHMNRSSPFPWISLASEGWDLGGAESSRLGKELAALAMSPDEGVEAVLRAASARPGSHVILSTGDLDARISRWQSPDEPREHPSSATHRPDLQTGYAAPGGETEKAVRSIWERLFGISGIGVNDDFFHLGGHSLLATQVLNQIQKRYPHARLTIGSIFDRPTIAGLAALIDASAKSPEQPEPAPGVPDVERMSNEEVEAMLRKLMDEEEI